MITKLSQVKAALSNGDLQGALRIAAKFHELGEHKNAIVSAHEAFAHPKFYTQLGRDIEAMKESGRIALISRFGE